MNFNYSGIFLPYLCKTPTTQFLPAHSRKKESKYTLRSDNWSDVSVYLRTVDFWGTGIKKKYDYRGGYRGGSSGSGPPSFEGYSYFHYPSHLARFHRHPFLIECARGEGVWTMDRVSHGSRQECLRTFQSFVGNAKLHSSRSCSSNNRYTQPSVYLEGSGLPADDTVLGKQACNSLT